MRVVSILNSKGRDVICAAPDNTVAEAIEILTRHRISAVVVDLPLVPVMPTTLCAGSSGRACAKSSISPMIGTPAASARAAIG